MNKVGLIEEVMKVAGIEVKKQAITAVDALFDTITKTIAKGDEVAIAGFGVFKTVK